MLTLLELEAPQVTAIEDFTGNLKGKLSDFLNFAFRGSRQDGPGFQRQLLPQLRQLLARLDQLRFLVHRNTLLVVLYRGPRLVLLDVEQILEASLRRLQRGILE